MEHSELIALWVLAAARFLYVIRQRHWVDQEPSARETAVLD